MSHKQEESEPHLLFHRLSSSKGKRRIGFLVRKSLTNLTFAWKILQNLGIEMLRGPETRGCSIYEELCALH